MRGDAHGERLPDRGDSGETAVTVLAAGSGVDVVLWIWFRRLGSVAAPGCARVPTVPIIMMTAFPPGLVAEAERLGAFAVVESRST